MDWLQSVELRRRVQVGLNKGEASNALARAVFLHRLGEIWDRGFEQQCYRASGLNLLTAAVVLWNTVYLQHAVHTLQAHGQPVDDSLLPYLSPLGWEHINLTGDYLWRTKRATGKCQRLGIVEYALPAAGSGAVATNERESAADEVARFSPLLHEHVNMLGRYDFTLPDRIAAWRASSPSPTTWEEHLA